jgi:hypothetical protein
MINIFSDASCRNFGNIAGINSYFVGTGLTHNLSSKDGCDLILDSINKVDYESDDNYLFFGEFDVRKSLGFGNLPHLRTGIRNTINKRKLNGILKNYLYLVELLPSNFKIITPISSFSLQLPSLEYFSTKLVMMFPEKIIDLSSVIINHKKRNIFLEINSIYKSEFYSDNPYICNSKNISLLFCDLIGISYLYEDKGNMHGYGTYYIE